MQPHIERFAIVMHDMVAHIEENGQRTPVTVAAGTLVTYRPSIIAQLRARVASPDAHGHADQVLLRMADSRTGATLIASAQAWSDAGIRGVRDALDASLVFADRHAL